QKEWVRRGVEGTGALPAVAVVQPAAVATPQVAPAPAQDTAPPSKFDCVQWLRAKAGSEVADASGANGGEDSVNRILSGVAEDCNAVMVFQANKPPYWWQLELIRSGEAAAKPKCVQVKTQGDGDAAGFIDVDQLSEEQLKVILQDCDNDV